MYPSFVIHHHESTDRDELVQDIVKKTKAIQMEAIWLDNKQKGCSLSHVHVAKMALKLYPLKHYLVFEDDCVLSDDWEEALKGMEMADVVYIGYNGKCEHTIFGTHALYLSPKARDVIIDFTAEVAEDVVEKWAFDHILTRLCRTKGLVVAMPKLEHKEIYAVQKKGLVSTITGNPRV